MVAIRLDEGLRRRLTLRFGAGVESWFDALPAVLAELAAGWGLDLGEPIAGGSVSVVLRCRTADARPAVLKVSPDRARIATEAAALRRWSTAHAAIVLAADQRAGALLLEAIEPGTPLAVSGVYPGVEEVAGLLTALHGAGGTGESFPTVEDRVHNLFASSARLYQHSPSLDAVVPRDLYERGHRFADRLARDALPAVLLHGDLTPSNVLDGGAARRLVAIDPAPCIGDPAFDGVDLMLWQASDVDDIEARVARLASATDIRAERMLDWCAAFASMLALELATSTNPPSDTVAALLALAQRTPTHQARRPG